MSGVRARRIATVPGGFAVWHVTPSLVSLNLVSLALVALGLVALCLWPTAVAAHTPIEGAGDFTGGLLHPVVVLPHLLTIIGLGLLLAQQPLAALRRVLPLFTAGLALALAASPLEPVAPAVLEAALLAVALLLGLAVALARALPAPVIAALAVCAALAIGLDSAPGLDSLWRNILTLTAIGVSVSVLLFNVVAVAGYARRPWQRLALRVVGSWLAASALMVGALALR